MFRRCCLRYPPRRDGIGRRQQGGGYVRQPHAAAKGAGRFETNSYPLGFSFKDDTSAIPVGLSPLDNGTKFRVVEFPPLDAATEAKMEPGFLMKAVGPVAPARGLPVTHPLMHRTRSVDYAVVLSGEIEMMLDDTVVHLKPGDTIVQQATNHAWVNRGTETCRILFVLMDSKQP
jgi:mannose-6-phosphate isomerase-like protein (cupin superfamily)